MRSPFNLSPFISAALIRFAFCTAFCASCGPDGDEASRPPAELGVWFQTPTAELPEKLSTLGLFPDSGEFEVVPDGVLAYQPAYPLWSNGSLKYRHVVLPEGSTIDTTEDVWQYPVGTILFKTFVFETAQGIQPVETRLIRKLESGWDYAVFLWDDDGLDATRIDLVRPVDVPVLTADGESFTHSVPNKYQCRMCHEAGDHMILGLNPRQLASAAGDPLNTWYEAGHLSKLPETPAPIEGDELTRQVKEYALGNCVNCHNGSGAPNSAYSLFPSDFIANTVGQPTQGNASAAGVRVVPGHPEQSILYLALLGNEENQEVKPMPPLGVQVRDAQAIAAFRAWIDDLDTP